MISSWAICGEGEASTASVTVGVALGKAVGDGALGVRETLLITTVQARIERLSTTHRESQRAG
ncbi:MAG: hypothetical protein QXP27_00955 [Candidatus Methanomethyliaceae archaeon]